MREGLQVEHWTVMPPGSGCPPVDRGVEAPLFSSEGWARVLEGIGCVVLPVFHKPSQACLQVPVFRRWGLKIGFLGFPVPPWALNCLTQPEFELECRGLARALSLDFVRAAWSSRGRPLGAEAVAVQPEAWIENLQGWDGEAGSKRLAKDLAHCRRNCAEVELGSEGLGSGDGLFELYARTVMANGGRIRYTAKYFENLAELARNDSRLQVVNARTRDGELLGFAVLACNEQTGYYLHGAVSPSARRMGLSDLLLDTIIGRAKLRGMHDFSLMASPAGQHGLVAFKRKWSNRVDSVVTVDTGNGLLGSMAALALRVGQRNFSRRMSGGGNHDGR